MFECRKLLHSSANCRNKFRYSIIFQLWKFFFFCFLKFSLKKKVFFKKIFKEIKEKDRISVMKKVEERLAEYRKISSIHRKNEKEENEFRLKVKFFLKKFRFIFIFFFFF